MKKCKKCNIEKELSEFSKHKMFKDGLNCTCKNCLNEHYRNNPTMIAYKKNNRELLNHRQNERRKRDLNNPEKSLYIKQRKAEWYQKNRDASIEKNRVWKTKNIEYRQQYTKNRYEANKKNLNKARVKQASIQWRNDPLYRTKEVCRKKIIRYLKNNGFIKSKSTTEILGANFKIVRKYIERQFLKGMTWENHSIDGWHIDHKIPLSSAKTEEELLKLFHYTNLQPLWSFDNLKKSNKILAIQTTMTI